MIVHPTKKFIKDIEKLCNKQVVNRLHTLLKELESAKEINTIKNLKKLAGYEKYYRIRIADFRLGIEIDTGSIILHRFLQRKDIYSYFP